MHGFVKSWQRYNIYDKITYMKNGKILIIEDEKDLRDIYSVILEHEGYDVHLAANGKDGLAAVKKYTPDLVLLDIFMPILDGKGFLEKLDMDQYPNTKVVVCSNTSDSDLLSDMLRLGADKVITKSDMGPSDVASLAHTYLRLA